MDPRLEPQTLVISYRSDEDGNEICLGHTWVPLSETFKDCGKFEWGKFEVAAADRPLPVTEDISRRVITVPFYSTITEDEMRTVATVLADAEAACKPKQTGRARQEARA